MKYWFAVEGNMGSGKSEFMELLHKLFDDNITCRKEPQYKWKCTQHSKECTSNLLDLFYSDTKRWSYTFETSAPQISGYIYLKKSPESCFETSKDIGIQLSYIKHLHEAYEEMFFEKSFQEIPTLTIDMSKEYTEHDYIEMLVSTFPILKNFVIPQKT